MADDNDLGFVPDAVETPEDDGLGFVPATPISSELQEFAQPDIMKGGIPVEDEGLPTMDRPSLIEGGEGSGVDNKFLSGPGSSLLRGATLGMSDIIETQQEQAIQEALSGKPVTYEEAFKSVKQAQNEGRQAFPFTSFLAEVAGTMFTGFEGQALGGAMERGMMPLIKKMAPLVEGKSTGEAIKNIAKVSPQLAEAAGNFVSSQFYKNLEETKPILQKILTTRNAAEVAAIGAEGGILGGTQAGTDDPYKIAAAIRDNGALATALGATVKIGGGLFSKVASPELKQAYKIGKDQQRIIINEADKITDRVSKLPAFIDDTLQTELTGPVKGQIHPGSLVGQKNKIIRDNAGLKLPIGSEFRDAKVNLMNSLTGTQDELAAKSKAIQTINRIEKQFGLKIEGKASDPFTGAAAKPGKKFIDVTDLAEAHKQVQDLLYDKEWRPGTQARRELVNFERKVRGLINSTDPSGDLAKYNNTIHSLLNAKEVADKKMQVNYWKGLASDPHNDQRKLVKESFEVNFQPKSENAKLKNRSFRDRGLDDAVSRDPRFKDRLDRIKAVIEAESSPAITDRAVLSRILKDRQTGPNIPIIGPIIRVSPANIANKLGKASTGLFSLAGQAGFQGLQARTPSLLDLAGTNADMSDDIPDLEEVAE